MLSLSRRGGFVLIGLFAGAMLVGPLTPITNAQDATEVSGDDIPEWVRKLAIDPDSSQAKKYAEQQKKRIVAEKQMRKLRAQYFKTTKKSELRQEGILKVREFEDPALFPAMIEVFGTEDVDVRTALLDHFVDAQCEEGDGSLSWMAVFDDDQVVRDGAAERLRKRILQLGHTPEPLKLVIYEGIASRKDTAMANAAGLAENLSIIEAIPWLINGQVQGAGLGNAGERTGALAWILVGSQTAFVSDLTPVVGPNAVGFDPQLSVVTEGTILRVIDAAVVTYHVDLNNALMGLSSKAWGQSTQHLGWNVPAWREWYAKEFVPYIAEKQKAEAEAADLAKIADKK